ncbi:SLC13 family permease, partial [Candidatus Sumerlaeota bacterium]|nr:SLC13 family permease [Candidatus Sumerlaeota bacterium]
MSSHAWIAVGVMVGTLLAMALTRIGPDLIALGGLTILLTTGALAPKEAFAGFSNDGMLTVAVLFVVAAGLRETGCIGLVTQYLLGRPKSLLSAQIRLMVPTIGLSAFVNNTPLVAILMPVVSDWAKKYKFSVSKLMIPLSYAAILGGTITMIGTSTNLVVNGLLVQHTDHPALPLFEIAWVGIPCAIAGLIYMLIFSRWLLPDRVPVISQLSDPRQYTVEMMVEPGSALEGQTIEKAGLRHLPGVFLIEIDRQGDVIAAVGPQEKLRGGDRLVFAGIVESVVDLQKIRGLTPATDQVFKLDSPRSQRCLVEAVVSNTCPIIGRSIREGKFRSVYNAAVIAVAHRGERVRKKIGD